MAYSLARFVWILFVSELFGFDLSDHVSTVYKAVISISKSELNPCKDNWAKTEN